MVTNMAAFMQELRRKDANGSVAGEACAHEPAVPLARLGFNRPLWAPTCGLANLTIAPHRQDLRRQDGNVLVTEDSSCADSHVGAAPGE